MHIPILEGRGGSHSAGLSVTVVLAALVLGGEMPRAQGTPTQAGPPNVLELQRGRPFVNDLRSLPANLPTQRERRPDRGDEREEPPLQALAGPGDRAAQTVAPAVAAPPPGSGSGAGSFAGLDFAAFGDGWPPDTNGDVGPTYYIQTVNTSVGIFRKSDGVRVAAFSFDTLMSQGNFGNACDNGNFGDPTVVWDPAADRWIISDFAFALNGSGTPVAPYFECFAVSRTGDPVTGGWNFYALQTTDLFPDYPKLAVWPDGLYLTASMFRGNAFRHVRVWALNKAQMYAGVPASTVTFNLPSSVQGTTVFTGLPSTYHAVTGAPPPGRPNFISVIWSAKVARVWKFHVDWTNPANSTLTGPSNVALATWGAGPTTVPAKNGNALDTLRERLMMQSQYTNLGSVESLWLTHTVANPLNTALASPRWYQLNVTGGTVVTTGPLQQSTWAPDSAVARWMPSLAVDKDGNMAIGYSASSATMFPAIRYAGRLSTDPASTLGQSETSLIEGTASQCCNFSDGSINNRWGDYSAMTIDPDGCTFWYTTQYYESPQPTSSGGNNWQTRIGSFKYPSCTPNSGTATLQGTVTSSATSNPISGALVTAGSSSTTTDGSGQYALGSLTPDTYTVTASASGYTNASASVVASAGVTTTQNFALVASPGATTSLAVGTASGTYGGTTTLLATLTSGGTGVSGKSIGFSLNGNAAGSASTNASGIATLSSVSLSGIPAGAYPAGVGASFAGDGSYATSSGTNSLSIAKANQTITFGPLPDKTTSDPPFAVSATASSTLTVAFAASGNCSLSGNTVTITAAGSCTITASQGGNSNYNPAPDVARTFNITTGGGGGASPDGTTVPPASQIIDSSGAVWTIGATQTILRNGAHAAGGFGSKILWSSGTVYVFGTDSNWWQWTASGWVNVGPVQPGGGGGGGTSADGTTVPPASQIIDSSSAVWTIGANQSILRNGAQAAGGFGSKILWSSGTIYVLGTDSNWWQWTGSGWVNVGPVQPGGGGGGGASPNGTLVPPATQIVDNLGAVWTIGANQTILRNGAQAAGGFGSKILWSSGTIYVLGTDSTWWQWTGSGWINVGPTQPG